MKLAIVYGSSMGNTEEAANSIKEFLGLEADVLNIADTKADDLNAYEGLICGTSTWNSGELQDDWEYFDAGGLDLGGKTVAVFGVGDSQSYSDEFCNGMKKLYDILEEKGAKFVGEISTDGYEFDESEAVNESGNFIGLALDYDNESEKSEERIKSWVADIKKHFE